MRYISTLRPLLVLPLLACPLFVAAQGSNLSGSSVDPQSLPTTFKSQSILVEVPAVVTDKNGKHIHGLSNNNFRILENGKEKKIAVFEEVTATTRPLAAEANPTGTYSNLSLSTEGRPALTIILFDEVNTPLLEQDYGRRQLIKYLAKNLNSQQVVELLLLGSKGVSRVANFTDDPSDVLNALQRVRGELPLIPSSSVGPLAGADDRSSGLANFGGAPHEETERELRSFLSGQDALAARFQRGAGLEDALQALLSISWSVSGVPGRKSLIWATSSFPLYLDSTSKEPLDPRLWALYERAIQALNDAQISVYPVDMRGVTSHALDPTIETMERFADMTGGRAFYGRNDLATGFQRAAEDSSSYYLLGYYLNSQNTKPGWRKLKVRLEDRSAEVRARQGFFVGSTKMSLDSSRLADVNFALSSPFESTGVPMLVRWNSASPAAGQKEKKAEFAIVVPANSVLDLSDRNQFDVDFAWEADRDGATGQMDGQTLKGSLDSKFLAQVRKDGVFYRNALQLPPGEYKVHFVVRNNLNGQIGSVTAPLTVN